jgi:hypothetical protein
MPSVRTYCGKPTLDNEDESGLLLTAIEYAIEYVAVSYGCHSGY